MDKFCVYLIVEISLCVIWNTYLETLKKRWTGDYKIAISSDFPSFEFPAWVANTPWVNATIVGNQNWQFYVHKSRTINHVQNIIIVVFKQIIFFLFLAKINMKTRRSLKMVGTNIAKGKVESTMINGKITLVKDEIESMFDEDWSITEL